MQVMRGWVFSFAVLILCCSVLWMRGADDVVEVRKEMEDEVRRREEARDKGRQRGTRKSGVCERCRRQEPLAISSVQIPIFTFSEDNRRAKQSFVWKVLYRSHNRI